MAEPTPEKQEEFDAASSLFWNATPATALFKAIYKSTDDESGSKIGDIIAYMLIGISGSEVMGEFIKKAMPNMSGIIETFLVKMGLPKEDAEGFTQYLNGLKLGSPLIDGILKSVVGIGTALKFTSAIWQVADQAIARTINRKAGLLPGDFQSLYRDRLLNPASDRYTKLVNDLGFSPTWQAAMENAQKVIVNPQEISELFRRGIWDKETADTFLRANQYEDKTQRERLLQLAIQLAPATTLLEMNKRGEITERQAIDGIRKFGFDDETIGLLVKESKPLLGTSEIVPLTLKGYMDQSEADKRLKMLGYSDADVKHINNLARKPLSENTLFQLMWRGFINEGDFATGMKKLGYNPRDTEKLRDILWQPAPPQDIIRFAVREVYSPEIVKKFGQYEDFPEQFAIEAAKVGISRELATQYWAAHWDLPAPGQGFDMYHRGIITRDELKMLLKSLDVMPFWRDKMIALNDSLITRRQLRELLREGIETPVQIEDRYFALGFSKKDSKTLTDLDLATIQKDLKDATKADLTNAYVAHIIEKTELWDGLIALGYSQQAQDLYLADAERKRFIEDTKQNLEPNQQQTDKARSDLTNDIVSEYQSGMIPRDVATNMLLEMGYWDQTADFFLAHADLQQLKRDLEYYASQIKRMFDIGAIDTLEANRQLTVKGYDVTAAGKIVSKWEYERYSDSVVQSVKVTNPTKAEFKKWAKTGIATVDEYNLFLYNLGYDEDTRIKYITELMLEVETQTE